MKLAKQLTIESSVFVTLNVAQSHPESFKISQSQAGKQEHCHLYSVAYKYNVSLYITSATLANVWLMFM